MYSIIISGWYSVFPCYFFAIFSNTRSKACYISSNEETRAMSSNEIKSEGLPKDNLQFGSRKECHEAVKESLVLILLLTWSTKRILYDGAW